MALSINSKMLTTSKRRWLKTLEAFIRTSVALLRSMKLSDTRFFPLRCPPVVISARATKAVPPGDHHSFAFGQSAGHHAASIPTVLHNYGKGGSLLCHKKITKGRYRHNTCLTRRACIKKNTTLLRASSSFFSA